MNSSLLYRIPLKQYCRLHWQIGMVAHACNPSIPEVGAGGSQVQGDLQLHSKYGVSMGYMRFCLKRKFQLCDLAMIILQDRTSRHILNFEKGLTSLTGHLLPPGGLLFSLQAGEIKK